MPYTQGTWKVKPGRAADFVSAWTEFADWTMREVPGASWAKLLRATTDENRFVSFGPWQSLEAIDAWRVPDESRTAAARLERTARHNA